MYEAVNATLDYVQVMKSGCLEVIVLNFEAKTACKDNLSSFTSNRMEYL